MKTHLKGLSEKKRQPPFTVSRDVPLGDKTIRKSKEVIAMKLGLCLFGGGVRIWCEEARDVL